jgi:predicted metal-dependent enzyme (double-stranded beta helix superfamily)
MPNLHAFNPATSPNTLLHSRSTSSLSDAQRSSLDEARGLYEVPLTDDLLASHADNQERVAAAIHAYFESQPGVVPAQDRPAQLAKDLYDVLVRAGFNPDIYLPKDPSHVHGYGKYLLYTDGNAGVPYCLQIFAFGGGQKTPIHDHPCECTSVVLKGTLRERLYHAVDDGTARKYKKQQRPTGSKESLDPGGPNIHSIKNAAQDAPAVSVHLYLLDGVEHQAAVNRLYQRVPKSDSAQSALRA